MATKKSKTESKRQRKSPPLLTLKEISFELGFTDRHVRALVKKGCPVRRMKPGKGKGGRARLMFDVRTVLDWLTAEGIEPKRDPGAVASSQKEVRADSVPESGTAAPTHAPDPDIPKSGIVGAIARLRAMERIAYASFLQSVKAKEPTARVRAKEQIYIKAHEALRRTEKDIPGILEHRGEAIPLETVLREQAKIDLAIKNQFLTLPRKLAQGLAAISDPGEIEEILINEIDDCLRHISSGGVLQDDTTPDV